MGNSQSAQGPRRGKKLSKPKTKPTGPPLSTSNSPNPSRRNSVTGKGIATAAASVLPHGKLVSVLETESLQHAPEPTPTKKKRMSIFRSRNSKKDTENSQLGASVDVVPSVSPPINTGRFTRSNSVNSVAVEATEEKSWAATSPRPSPRPDSINVATNLAGQHGGEMDWQLSDPFCQRTQSDPAIYAPIRRKSLLQHGVATRHSVISNPQSFQNQIPVSYQNIGKWSVAPLTLRTNVDNENHGARTSTPNDLGHIGSFQLGSLRITNGSASPTPSADERRASLPSNDQHIATLQASSRIQGIANRSYTISVPAEAMKRPWAPTSFSQSPIENDSHDSLTIKIPSTTSTFNSPLSPTNTHSLNLPPQLSPFSFVASPIGSPLEATSKNTAVEDELFEAEMTTPTLESSYSNDNRSFDSGYGPSPATPEQQTLGRIQSQQDMVSKQLATTDSGYNSSTSRKNSTARVSPARISLRTTEAPPLSNHAIPMVSLESQKMTRLSNVSLPSSSYQSQVQQPTPMSYRQSMPAAPRQPQNFTAGETSGSHWGVQRQRPQSFYPGAPRFTAQSRSRSEMHLPTAASFQNSDSVDEIMEYKTMRRVSSKETITTITSLEPGEVESTYNRLHNAIPPIPSSIPEEDYHTGWKPPNARRHSYAPSTPSTPKNRYTLQPYQAPASLNTYPQEDQTDFENHLTSFDNIKNSLGGSPYDLALTAMERTPPRGTPRGAPAPKMKSAAAQLQSTHANLIRSQSEEPLLSRPDINGRQDSYNKLVGGNPFDHNSTGPSSRATSSSSTFTLRDLPSQRRTAEEDTKRLSIARTSRVNSPPPVSFQNQRKSVSVPAPGQLALPKLRSTSVAQSPLSQPLSPETMTSSYQKSVTPPPRSLTSPIREVPSQGSLASGQELWFDSKEHIIPAQLQIGHADRPSKIRSQSARPATQYHRPIPLHHFSFDVQEKSGNNSRAASLYSEKEWEVHAGAYDHTYGSSTNLHDLSGEFLASEYDTPSFEESQPIPDMGSSTQDMLVLDRYAGGLGYGFEPGYGLGGSAGTRNSGTMNNGGRKGVDVSKQWGLDFSDVPIIMQRVPVGAGI
ncbi:putative proteophosphoglycan ppg4 protein [Botrytis fragariae]|uniref:Putative proteophosphoglycan ppg4 protein n=1 Tax=Botrytis fragariae TaxID=1964551 RepID=A0A8H6EMK4_9HELO|nr:putative proteophosphoglycan ppg4 protein [Botrytis fragariae]KAF5877619.1 putative proteophosphoglycan ppg4 protein [Botrytis fragariae]